jgi:Tol biopolymer transport system component
LTLAFQSTATNLVEGEVDTNGETEDIFVHDVVTGETVNVTQGGNGYSYDARLSADGSKVTFFSRATNLVDGEDDPNGSAPDLFVYDLATGETVNVTQGGYSYVSNSSLSADGSTGAFSGLGENGSGADVFVFDLA